MPGLDGWWLRGKDQGSIIKIEPLIVPGFVGSTLNTYWTKYGVSYMHAEYVAIINTVVKANLLVFRFH